MKLTHSFAIFALLFANLAHATETEVPVTPTAAIEEINAAAEESVGLVLNTVDAIYQTVAVEDSELDCLAKNIFYEAANETEEGKVAVGIVTLNRSEDRRFPNTICGVINQKKEVTQTNRTRVKVFRPYSKFILTTVSRKQFVCQFSWRCIQVSKPETDDQRWQESQRIARELLTTENYNHYEQTYGEALYFHSVKVMPTWAHHMRKIKRIGGHIFYSERDK